MMSISPTWSRRRRRALSAAALAVLLAGGGAATAVVPRWSAPAPTVRLLGRLAPSRRIDFTLDLVLPGARALRASLTAIENPRSRQFHRYLDAQQFGARYGLPVARLAELERTLARAGLTVTERYPQRTALRVRGSVGAVRRLFGVAIGRFDDRAGERWHAPLTQPAIPRSLAAAVSAVS